jgi:hypothetical protein
MEDNLVRLLQGSIDAVGVSALARQLGHGEGEIGSALSIVIPTFVSGLAHRAASPGGAAQIRSALDSSDQRLLDDVPGAIEHERVRLMDDGSSILNTVYGDKLGSVQASVGSATGLGKGAAASLMRLHAPIALAAIARHYRGRIHGERDLARELAAEGALADAFLPRSLAPMLAREPERAVAEPTSRSVPPRKRGVPTAHSQLGATPGGPRREGGPGRFLIPAAIGAAILAAVLMFVGPRDRDPGEPALLGRPGPDDESGAIVEDRERREAAEERRERGAAVEAREDMDRAGEEIREGARETEARGRDIGERTGEAFREGGRAVEQGAERVGERMREAWESTEEAVEEGFEGARREGRELTQEADESARELKYESSRFFDGQDTELSDDSREAIDEIVEEHSKRETDRVTIRGPNPSQLDSLGDALEERGVSVAKEVDANLDQIEVRFER